MRSSSWLLQPLPRLFFSPNASAGFPNCFLFHHDWDRKRSISASAIVQHGVLLVLSLCDFVCASISFMVCAWPLLARSEFTGSPPEVTRQPGSGGAQPCACRFSFDGQGVKAEKGTRHQSRFLRLSLLGSLCAHISQFTVTVYIKPATRRLHEH